MCVGFQCLFLFFSLSFVLLFFLFGMRNIQNVHTQQLIVTRGKRTFEFFDLCVEEYEEKQNIKHHARTYKIPRLKKSKCQRNACCR